VAREDAIWVAPFVNVIKYIRERDDANVGITVLSNYSFTLFLNSSLDPVIYNQNLTLNITVPLNWTEVQVRIGNESQIVTPLIAGENRSFLYDSPINETVTISRTEPVLSFIEAAPGANSSFFPESGDSNTVFTFKVNYSSPINLSPNPAVECLLDLNGDGDILDAFGSMSEGTYLMEKLNATDTDYTDGCLYQFNTSFPFASSPWFAFSAEDIEGRSAFDPDNLTTMKPGPIIANFTVLKEGWNLISTPLEPSEESITKLLESLEGLYDNVMWFNDTAGHQEWGHYHVDKTPNADLFGPNLTSGIWVNITAAGDTIFYHNGTLPVQNQSVIIYPGWNLVGYPSLTERNLSAALYNLNLGSDIESVWTYDAESGGWIKLKGSDQMRIGQGYWMYSKAGCIWEVPL
jgi:hypothetical protein